MGGRSGLGIKPSWVTIKRRDSLADAVARADIPVGDWTLSLGQRHGRERDRAGHAGRRSPDRHRPSRVNQPGRTYYWSASQRRLQPSDLSPAMTVSDLGVPIRARRSPTRCASLNQGAHRRERGSRIGDLLPAGLVYQWLHRRSAASTIPTWESGDLGSLARLGLGAAHPSRRWSTPAPPGRVITNWAYVLDLDQIRSRQPRRIAPALRLDPRRGTPSSRRGVDRATATEGDSR